MGGLNAADRIFDRDTFRDFQGPVPFFKFRMCPQERLGIRLSEFDVFRGNNGTETVVQSTLLENMADFYFARSRGNSQWISCGGRFNSGCGFRKQYGFLLDSPEVVETLPFD